MPSPSESNIHPGCFNRCDRVVATYIGLSFKSSTRKRNPESRMFFSRFQIGLKDGISLNTFSEGTANLFWNNHQLVFRRSRGLFLRHLSTRFQEKPRNFFWEMSQLAFRGSREPFLIQLPILSGEVMNLFPKQPQSFQNKSRTFSVATLNLFSGEAMNLFWNNHQLVFRRSRDHFLKHLSTFSW